VRRIKRLLQLTLALIGAALYVWYAAVRSVPVIKRRKAARRRAKEGG
jgi:hypothetical protein